MDQTMHAETGAAMDTSATSKTLHLIIQGRVQGVYFRQSMLEEAERLGVSGWARNLPDRSVEAMVQGGADEVDAIVRWAQRGPMMASVEKVVVSPGTGSYSGFEIR
jgi:acylphosphatase